MRLDSVGPLVGTLILLLQLVSSAGRTYTIGAELLGSIVDHNLGVAPALLEALGRVREK